MGINPPEDEEPRSLSPGGQEVVPEPAQQLADEFGDVIMESDVSLRWMFKRICET